MNWLSTAALIGLAGFVGSICRFAVSGAVTVLAPRGFPTGTLVVNATGCVLLAFFLTLIRDRVVSDALRLAIAVGFVGAYTTFSTFAYEIYELARSGHSFRAGLYLILSVALGLAGVYLGILLAHRLERS
ncbi:MAG TPA: fluoride efflux transporter CrcB [Phycisphaerae bacterium]|nr:fluoride efflux transporter CrcB [Phycisphaerae bacterium]